MPDDITTVLEAITEVRTVLPYWCGVYWSSLVAEEALCVTLAWVSWSARLSRLSCPSYYPRAGLGRGPHPRPDFHIVREGNVWHIRGHRPSARPGPWHRAEVIPLSRGASR